MGSKQWIVVALLAAASAQAQDAASSSRDNQARIYIAPYAGYAHLRVDRGRIYEQDDTVKVDALQVGGSLGFRAPFGLTLEVGQSDALHASWFDDHGDLELTHRYVSLGWRVPAGERWYLTPRVGRLHWTLESSHRWLFENGADRDYEIDGYENFWELGLSHELNPHISLGLNFKDVNEDFGHSRSLAFVASFAF